MQFNSFVFPKPVASYITEDWFGKVIYVPKDPTQWKVTAPFVSFQVARSVKGKSDVLSIYGGHYGPCIPCLFIPAKRPSTKLLLHFHANAEDISHTVELLKLIRDKLNVHIFAMEYRGYGLYKGEPSSDTILLDADIVFQYLLSLGFTPGDIIPFGRSIGSGPACFLASKYQVHSLILMSAFTSLRAVVKSFVGSVLQYLVAERFDNKTWISNAECPIFIIHGCKDEVVAISQARELYELAKGKAQLYTPKEMDHNSFNFMEDFIIPLANFYLELGFQPEPRNPSASTHYFPIKAFNKPT